MFFHGALPRDKLEFTVVLENETLNRFEGDRPRFRDRDGYRAGPRGPAEEFAGEKGRALDCFICFLIHLSGQCAYFTKFEPGSTSTMLKANLKRRSVIVSQRSAGKHTP
nr:40S ribosomal protein S10-1-like [Tanacetum cinerariifolium]